MTATARPRRSMLYMPGSNARALDKGRRLPADALILDLEDAVAPDAKTDARGAVAAALAEGGYGRREVLVRVNGLETPWGPADIERMAAAGADGLVLPKAESAEAVRAAGEALADAGAPDDLALWCMIETPRGVLRAEAIPAAHPRVAGFIMGTSDLAKDLHARHTPERTPFLASLGHVVLVARAFGLAAIDGVHLDLDDADGFAAQCRQGAEFGFDGKSLIHPKTIAAANAAFGPDAVAIAHSRRIIAAHEEAAARGDGVAVLDGKLIESLHVEEARRLLALDAAIRALEEENAAS